MNIKVLGVGCANCHALEAAAKEAAGELGINADVELITDYGVIMGYGVMSTPGLVIDEKVVCAGRVPAKDEVKSFIQAAL
jgi:small redox-active disulfide protein 2